LAKLIYRSIALHDLDRKELLTFWLLNLLFQCNKILI
jgi:hypothetical protein